MSDIVIYNLDVPVEQVITNIIAKFYINQIQVNPFTSAIVSVSLCKEDGDHITDVTYIMDGDEYAAWNDDDDYLINWIKLQIQKNYRIA